MIQNTFRGQLHRITFHVVPIAEPISPVVLVHGEETIRVLWTNENGHILLEFSVNLEYSTPQYASQFITRDGHSKPGTDIRCIVTDICELTN
jgi:hypothetical protein